MASISATYSSVIRALLPPAGVGASQPGIAVPKSQTDTPGPMHGRLPRARAAVAAHRRGLSSSVPGRWSGCRQEDGQGLKMGAGAIHAPTRDALTFPEEELVRHLHSSNHTGGRSCRPCAITHAAQTVGPLSSVTFKRSSMSEYGLCHPNAFSSPTCAFPHVYWIYILKRRPSPHGRLRSWAS